MSTDAHPASDTDTGTTLAEAEAEAEPERHEFLFSGGYGEMDPFECALQLADAIADKPKTAATMHPSDMVDDFVVNNLDDRVLHLLGSWRVPDHYTSNSGKGTKWVNPRYQDKQRYADSGVYCECGALVLRFQQFRGESLIGSESDHAPDCRISWRLRAQARLSERRNRIIRDMLELGHDSRAIFPRLGLSASGNLSRYVDDPNLDVSALKDHSRQVLANTAADLLTRYPASDVGTVFGFGAKAITDIVNEQTGENAHDLWIARMENESEELRAEYRADVQRVANRDKSAGRLTSTTYNDCGKWAVSTLCTQFDCGWAGVLDEAGLPTDVDGGESGE